MSFRETGIILSIICLSYLPACSRPTSDEIERGQILHFSVEGLPHTVERSISIGDERVFIIGHAGREGAGRLIWADLEGNVLTDVFLNDVHNPVATSTCVSGQRGRGFFVTEDEGHQQVMSVTIRGDGPEPGSPVVASLVHSSTGNLQVRSIEGVQGECALCIYDEETEQLVCSGEEGVPQRWEVGDVGQWRVFQSGGSLSFVDWRMDGRRWVTVRTAQLDGSGGTFQWEQAYIVGRRSEHSMAESGEHTAPRFLFSEEGLTVLFMDSTSYYPRLYTQLFHLDERAPEEAFQVAECDTGCQFRWSGVIQGDQWLWFRSSGQDVGLKLNRDDHTTERILFTAPRSVLNLDNGYFKVGLSGEITNWWGLIEEEEQ
jgi:hypothetical protein